MSIQEHELSRVLSQVPSHASAAMINRERYIGGVLVRWAVAGDVIFLDVEWLRVVRRCQPR